MCCLKCMHILYMGHLIFYILQASLSLIRLKISDHLIVERYYYGKELLRLNIFKEKNFVKTMR